ncbi:hypothetical protein [Stutzerimonas chloritidismutans]|uniref:hypothetical protein n=1 Tax=Stutzerimonas chloritidismutans TaxID=203192 RepID=UPI003F1578F5
MSIEPEPNEDQAAQDLPDVTMTDAGEKEPGEDPDFDDSELDGPSENRGQRSPD